MELTAGTATRSSPNGRLPDETGLDSLQFREEIQRLITAPPENGTSFTALLGLPATQAMELLNSSNSDGASKRVTLFNGDHKPLTLFNGDHKPFFHPVSVNSTSPPISSPVQLAAKFPGFIGEQSPEATSSVPTNSNANLEKVKSEPVAEANSTPNSLRPSLDPSLENANQKSAKRKEPEKKGKGSAKKSKTEKSENSEKLPYVHVRARRGEATDNHSLAERARREKINARMKLLQELVPGCNKVSGTALVLDEIINHVQSLQRQVEFLSMRLAAVNPRIDFNLDSLFAAESPSLVASNFPGMVTPLMWPEGPSIGNTKLYHHPLHLDPIHHASWGREDDNRSFITPENSLLTYDSPISASLHSNQLKMELKK